MSVTNWVGTIDFPKDGQPVNELTAKTALQQLSDRTEYLRQGLEDYSLKSGKIVLYSVNLEPGVEEGDCVYYNPTSQAYGKAIAEGDVNPDTGVYESTLRSFAVGVCVRKISTSNSGDVLCFGFSNLTSDWAINPISLFDITSDYNSSGTRGYLSSRIPGKLTSKPTSPLIQVGMFADELSYVCPLQKDIFESHLHYKFNISPFPASSQNFAQTGTGKIGDEIFVNYCSSHAQMPGLIMCIRFEEESSSITRSQPGRIEIRHGSSSNYMGIKIFSGIDLDKSLINSGVFFTEITNVEWPEYGEWTTIPGTGLSVSFFRADGTYAQTLKQDIAANSLFTSSHVFKVFGPDDFSGWTNANPFESPLGAKFRLGHEYVSGLKSVWPPAPISSTEILSNGFHKLNGVDFIPSLDGVYWADNVPPPWFWNNVDGGIIGVPEDYLIVNEDLVMELSFSNSSLDNSRSVVLSLDSASPMISVIDCFSGKPSTSGHLKLDLDLALNEKAEIDGGKYIALVGVEPKTNKFLRGTMVSEILSGPGISVVAAGSTGGMSKNIGAVRISAANLKFEGVVDIVSLINAKEDFINEIVPCVYFLRPSQGRCRMVSRVTIPNRDMDGFSSISLKLFPQPFGEASGSGVVTFSATSYIVKEATNMNGLVGSPSSMTEFLINLSGYVGKTILEEKEIEVSGLSPGDQVFTVWERQSSITSPSGSDTYASNFGFTKIRWEIETE